MFWNKALADASAKNASFLRAPLASYMVIYITALLIK